MPLTFGGWFAPRSEIEIVELENPKSQHAKFEMHCTVCGKRRGPSGISSAREEKRHHQCPHGTEGAIPGGPNCHSTTARCKRPSGHDASEWHAERMAAWREFVSEDEEEVVIVDESVG